MPYKNDPRTNSYQRGYDNKWRKLRNLHIKENPLCDHCLFCSKKTQANMVDHINPFEGTSDALRLDSENLQSLCWACHRNKTVKDENNLIPSIIIVAGPGYLEFLKRVKEEYILWDHEQELKSKLGQRNCSCTHATDDNPSNKCSFCLLRDLVAKQEMIQIDMFRGRIVRSNGCFCYSGEQCLDQADYCESRLKGSTNTIKVYVNSKGETVDDEEKVYS